MIRIWKAIIQREAVAAIEQQRIHMTAALFANPNWDGENSEKRTQQIQAWTEHFNRAVELVYYPEDREPEIDWDNPFYAAAKRGLERTRLKYGLGGDQPMGEVIEQTTTEEDQARIRARLQARRDIDQVK